jgi:hypothetical protein
VWPDQSIGITASTLLLVFWMVGIGAVLLVVALLITMIQLSLGMVEATFSPMCWTKEGSSVRPMVPDHIGDPGRWVEGTTENAAVTLVGHGRLGMQSYADV